MADPGGIPFGHFTLGKRLARGGMAEVFLARQRGPEGFERRVAVKRILPHLADAADFVRMFLDEARLAARLSHPNIVHIYELGNVAGDYFIAMEYVDGIHAGQLVTHAAREAVPPELVARIGADAAGALAYAHRLADADGRPLQLVHRDVSPQNIMVSSDGIVKLVDFGIAKAARKAEETRPGVVKGKYAYMSPEQTTGKPLDGRSDVFSLGVVLWEIVAGRTIVERGDVVEAMKVMRDGKFRSIREVAPRTPAPLADAITRALTLRKDDRPTATQLQAMLEAYIKGAPRLATPVQLAEWIAPRFPRGQLADEPGAERPRTAATSATPLRPARPSTDVAVVTSDPLVLPLRGAGQATRGRAATDDGRDVDLDSAGGDDDAGQATIEMPPPALAGGRAGTAGDDDAGQATIEVPPPVLVPGRRGTSRAEPSTAMVKPLPPPPRASRPPPVPRAPTVDHLPDVDVDVGAGIGDGTTRLHRPPAHRLPARRSVWPPILLALIALTVIAIVVTLLVRRGAPPLPAVAPPAHDARAADAGFTVTALDGGADDAQAALAPADADADGGAGGDAGATAAAALDARSASEDDVVLEPAIEPAATTATLEIVTTPAGARVELAGQPAQLAPATIAGLPPGRVSFAVAKDGFAPVQRTVTLAAGEHRTVELALARAAGPRRKVGTLSARTEPYSLVYLRGRLLGETPFAGVELPAGTHTLVFKHPGKKPQVRRVTITAGRTAKVAFRLP